MLRRMGRFLVMDYSRRGATEHREFPLSFTIQNMCGVCLPHTPRNLLIPVLTVEGHRKDLPKDTGFSYPM